MNTSDAVNLKVVDKPNVDVEALVTNNIKLAYYMASQLGRAYHIDKEEAEQQAILGLVKAANAFDPSISNNFSSMAAHYIRNSLRRSSRMLRGTPMSRVDLDAGIGVEADASGLGTEATGHEVVGGQDVVGAEGPHLGKQMDLGHFDSVTKAEIDKLPSRDGGLLKRWLNGETYRDIAKDAGISFVQVGKIVQRALAQLRQQLAKQGVEGPQSLELESLEAMLEWLAPNLDETTRHPSRWEGRHRPSPAYHVKMTGAVSSKDDNNSCDQCNGAMVQGVFTHEHGCPNRNKIKASGRWVTQDQLDDMEFAEWRGGYGESDHTHTQWDPDAPLHVEEYRGHTIQVLHIGEAGPAEFIAYVDDEPVEATASNDVSMCLIRARSYIRKVDYGRRGSVESLIEKKLSFQARKQLPKGDFVFPKERRYPIEDKAHARNALARVSQHGTSAEKAKVRSVVHRKYPGIGKVKENLLTKVGQENKSLESLTNEMTNFLAEDPSASNISFRRNALPVNLAAPSTVYDILIDGVAVGKNSSKRDWIKSRPTSRIRDRIGTVWKIEWDLNALKQIFGVESHELMKVFKSASTNIRRLDARDVQVMIDQVKLAPRSTSPGVLGQEDSGHNESTATESKAVDFLAECHAKKQGDKWVVVGDDGKALTGSIDNEEEANAAARSLAKDLVRKSSGQTRGKFDKHNQRQGTSWV